MFQVGKLHTYDFTLAYICRIIPYPGGFGDGLSAGWTAGFSVERVRLHLLFCV